MKQSRQKEESKGARSIRTDTGDAPVRRCEMKYVLLEMDHILRPNGYAIIRESSYFVDAIATMAKVTRWSCRKEATEYGVEKEKILI
ncbi:hypothetical protein RND71_015743 [Anisodus tanguticus]|uniref:Methyltransferase n=1 Tax=Anisodus tanguticus TaxID=243964 RepID=A0AAE1S6W0_9SOLA|nr:hypothetical protein RND71_015743 [Anisodus tanguticus]